MTALEVSLAVEGQEGVSWAQWHDLATAAERLGFAGLYRSDHYLSEVPNSHREALDAWGAICGLAAVTSRLRLGTLVSPVTFRHPSVLAKLVLTADQISGGRVELGIGAGWMREEHEMFGLPFPGLRDRLQMLDEQLTIIRRCFTDGPFSYTGSHYEVRELESLPRPAARPHPRLIVGGEGGPRSIAIAVAQADEYNTPLPTDDQIRECRERLAAACDSIGRDPSSIALSVTTRVVVGRDRDELKAAASRAARADGKDDQSPAAYLGELSDCAVTGTVGEAIERLHGIAELGVTRIMLESIDHSDLAMIELIGTEILPAVGGN